MAPNNTRAVLLLLLVVAGMCPMPGAARDDCRVVAGDFAVAVRSGPSFTDYGIVGAIPEGGSLFAVGRSTRSDWYAVDFNGARAWVSAAVVSTYGGACGSLPSLPAPPLPADLESLQTVPILPTFGTHVQEVFGRGQARGRNPHVFAKIGDCNSEISFYLAPFDLGMYELGPYAELQATVDWFAGSFAQESVAAAAGNTTFMVLDPALSDPVQCETGEALLACEYRRLNPAVALIGLGNNDVRHLSIEEYIEYMRQVVEFTLAADIIPVLHTFTARPDQRWERSLAVDMAMVEIAREYDVPLINFWRAARTLPDFGLLERSTRLTHGWWPGAPIRIDFDAGQEAVWGHALRNLLTLQTLDALRAEVLAEDSVQ